MKSPRLQNLTIFMMGVLNSYRDFHVWDMTQIITDEPDCGIWISNRV